MRFFKVLLVVVSILISTSLVYAAEREYKFGYVLHVPVPFTAAIQKGAEDAGKDFGVQVQVVCPPKYDPQAAIALFEGFVTQKVDGIVVIPQPGDTWVVPINEAIEAGIPVLAANVESEKSKRIAWVGQDEYDSGRILAREVAKRLKEQGKKGKIIVGTCVPGLSVLEDRFNGFKEVMSQYPEFEILGPYDVTSDMTSNYAAWENLIAANPDLIAAVGLCSIDIPNLARLKEKTGMNFFVAGYDFVEETIIALQKGLADVSVGQHPYLQGYLPIKALAEYYLKGKEIPAGWIKVPTEVFTKDSPDLDKLYKRETDYGYMTEWYKEFIAQNFAELKAIVTDAHPANPWKK
jgi:ABC-type sugar transport system substrate-binding protein